MDTNGLNCPHGILNGVTRRGDNPGPGSDLMLLSSHANEEEDQGFLQNRSMGHFRAKNSPQKFSPVNYRINSWPGLVLALVAQLRVRKIGR